MLPMGSVKVVKGGAAEGAKEVIMGPPKLASRKKYEDSEVSASYSDVEVSVFGEEKVTGKRPKVESPLEMEIVNGNLSGKARKKRKIGAGKERSEVANKGEVKELLKENIVSDEVFRRVKKITNGLIAAVQEGGSVASLTNKVLESVGGYEEVLVKLMGEIERLKGRLEVIEAANVKVATGCVSGCQVAPAVVQTAVKGSMVSSVGSSEVVVQPPPKPVETWSVVVKGKGQATSKEVVKKVVDQVGPTLGVRVHEVRPTRDGGAVIRTPSVAERKRIVDNKKFDEVGLEVSVKDKLGPKLTVLRVHAEITPDEFMQELYSMNLKEMFSPEAYKKNVRLVSGPWKVGGGGQVNVTLECTERVAEHLRTTGVYIKWFRFVVRTLDAVPACYRCLGFDHRVRDCRMKDDVCRRCGTAGHMASRCPNDLRCRNCAFKGLPSNHLMMSDSCPVYAVLTAKAKARH